MIDVSMQAEAEVATAEIKVPRAIARAVIGYRGMCMDMWPVALGFHPSELRFRAQRSHVWKDTASVWLQASDEKVLHSAVEQFRHAIQGMLQEWEMHQEMLAAKFSFKGGEEEETEDEREEEEEEASAFGSGNYAAMRAVLQALTPADGPT